MFIISIMAAYIGYAFLTSHAKFGKETICGSFNIGLKGKLLINISFNDNTFTGGLLNRQNALSWFSIKFRATFFCSFKILTHKKQQID